VSSRLRVLVRRLRRKLWLMLALCLVSLLSFLFTDFSPVSRNFGLLLPFDGVVLIAGLILILFFCLRSLSLSEKIKSLVIRENLTGLFDRDFALHRLKEECYRSRRYHHPLSLIMIELDDFETMNFHYGHSSGDHFLRYFGSIIGQTIRPSDIAARFDGQKFLLVFPETGKEEARKVADRLKEEILLHPFRIEPESREMKFTFTAGVSSFPEDAESAEGLLERAKEQLSICRRKGSVNE